MSTHGEWATVHFTIALVSLWIFGYFANHMPDNAGYLFASLGQCIFFMIAGIRQCVKANGDHPW